ncbi:MAG: 30S ribosomal protein S2 [Candidatus Micrarchaeia archaeon]|jgi:small subunit ribosomal protein S2
MEEKDFDDQKNESGLLVKQDKYLEAGVHIGTKIKSGGMNKYIYRKRKDGLYVLDLKKIDERIRLAAKQLGRFEAEDILVVASRTYSGIAAANFCKITGTKLVAGRFIPGTLTNPRKNGFFEPEILLVCDPRGEKEALREAGNAGIPVIGLSDVDNSIKFIDWVVPCNNKGRRSLALIFYLLAREFLVSKGMIKSYDEFKYSIKDFSNDSSFKEIGNLDEQKEEEEKAKEEEIIKTAKQIDEAPLKKIEKAVKPKEEKPKEEIKIDRPKFIKQQKAPKKIREKTKEEQEESKPKTFKLEKPKENKKSETQKEPEENKTEEKE